MRSPVWSLMVVGLMVLCLACLLTTHVTLAFALATHPCASPMPPVVPGPLFQPATTQGNLYINEVLLTPHSNWNCSEVKVYTPENDTWVELYNPQNQPLDLYAVHASIDSGPNTNAFYLPFGSAIAAHGYFVVFPRTDTGFTSTETSTWRLLVSGIVVDEVKLPALGEDQSYARIPDGSSSWQITSTPTIDASNALIAPTATKTTHSSSTTGATGGSGTGTTGTVPGQEGQSSEAGSQAQQVDGHQPSWDKLQSSAQVAATTPLPTSSSYSSTPDSPVTNGPRRIVLTILMCALALALIWCWRIYIHPSQKPANMISSTQTDESKGRI